MARATLACAIQVDGVMAAQQILVLLVLVRIQVDLFRVREHAMPDR